MSHISDSKIGESFVRLEAHVRRLFQITYEGDFRSLCTVTFYTKGRFLN